MKRLNPKNNLVAALTVMGLMALPAFGQEDASLTVPSNTPVKVESKVTVQQTPVTPNVQVQVVQPEASSTNPAQTNPSQTKVESHTSSTKETRVVNAPAPVDNNALIALGLVGVVVLCGGFMLLANQR